MAGHTNSKCSAWDQQLFLQNNNNNNTTITHFVWGAIILLRKLGCCCCYAQRESNYRDPIPNGFVLKAGKDLTVSSFHLLERQKSSHRYLSIVRLSTLSLFPTSNCIAVQINIRHTGWQHDMKKQPADQFSWRKKFVFKIAIIRN